MIKTLTKLASKVAGVLLMAVAFLQWITFSYPDVNPFWPGAIFVPGMLSQVLNWVVVAVLGTAGWGLFTFGHSRASKPSTGPTEPGDQP